MTALVGAAAVPAAHARPSVVVQASAVAVPGAAGQLDVRWQCATADTSGGYAWLHYCKFGGVDAYPECQDWECPADPAVFASGSFAFGPSYELCVAAVMATQYVAKCAPFDYLTRTAVIAG